MGDVPSSNYLPRFVDRWLRDALDSFPVVILDGPRAVGKTTTARQVARSSIQLPRDLPLLQTDPRSILESLESPALIDEWQLGGLDLLWALKEIVDTNPAPGRFVLTGSVEPASYGPTYPLTGRAGRIVMQPMSRSEIEGRGSEGSFLESIQNGGRPKAQVGSAEAFRLDWLTTTGFPAAREQSDATMFLDGYAALVAQRAGDEGRDSSRVLRSLAVLGVLSAQAVPDQTVWESADVNKATWKRYEDLLGRVHLNTPLPALSSNALKRVTNYPKRFLVDTALALALAGLDIEDLRRDPALAGRYVESYVVQQLRAQIGVLGGRLWHVRTSAGEREIDVLADLGSIRVAVEVKMSPRPDSSDAKHLSWLRDSLEDEELLCVVVHTGSDTYLIEDGIWALPIGLLG